MGRTAPKGSLHLDVQRPIKTDERYEFRVEVSGRPFTPATAVQRLASVVQGYGSPFRTTERFGFRAVNYRIAHAEVWDSIVPLFFLTRNHGPLYKKGYDSAVIRFRYPILEPVRRFFIRRAVNLGLSIEVQADTFERTYDIRGRGDVISFGNGKESRLLLGLLREIGHAPRLATGGSEDKASDVGPVEFSELLAGVTSERVLPGLMSGAAHYYYGSGLGEVHLTRPWHQYYDRSSPQGQRELTELLRSLGVDVTLHAPLCVLPSNLIQHMLAVRYPDLYAQQWSVTPGSPSEKNLDVSLLKLYRDLPIASHCSDDLFRQLLRKFVARKLAAPGDFGFNNHRELHHREMMAIILRRSEHRLLRDARGRIPPGWDAAWIDGIHTYANADVDTSMLGIFRQYASDYVPGPGDYRVATPDVADQRR